MKVKLINKTNEILNLDDIGLSIQSNETIQIDTNLINLTESRILFRYISESKITVNDFDRDLLPAEGVLFITQGFINPKDSDGKLFVHQTSRVPGCMTYWTGKGDDPTNIKDIGHGEPMIIKHSIGDPLDQFVYLDFHTIDNKSFLHEGYFIWENAKFGDFITLESVVNTVTYEIAENTFYNLYGGFLVVPAAGDGTINITSDITNPAAAGGSLVQVYTDETGYRPSAFWDADYNSETGLFENIRPNVEAKGEFNMYTVELIGNRFINHIPVLNSGFEMLQSSDSTFFPHGIRIKATITTTNDDHEWFFGGIMTMHRERTA